MKKLATIKTAIGEVNVCLYECEADTIITVEQDGNSISEVRITNEDTPEVTTFLYREGCDEPLETYNYNR